MPALTSQLVIQLVDRVSGVARGIAGSLRGVQNAARALNATSVASVSRQFSASAGRMRAAVGSVGTSISTAATGLGLYKLHRDVYEFSKATNLLAAANPDATAEQIQKIQDVARDVSRTSIFDGATVMQAANALARADVSVAAITGTLKPLALASMAADVPISQLSDDFVGLASTFGMPVKTAKEAAETFGYLGDMATYVSQKAPGSFNDYVQAMKQVGPVVRTLGVDVEWLAGAYIKMDKAGIRNAEAGTALKSLFKSIVHPTAGARGMLAQLGIERTEFAALGDYSADQLVNRLKADFGKNFSGLTGKFRGILDKKLPFNDLQTELTEAIAQGWGGEMRPVDQRKLVKSVQNYLESGITGVDPQKFIDALGKRGVTFGQLLQIVEPRQAQRLSSIMLEGKDDKQKQAAKDLWETPVQVMSDFKRGLSEIAGNRMMRGYMGAIARLQAAWTSFIEALDRGGVIDKVAGAIERLGGALSNVFQGKGSLSDWAISLTAALPLIAPVATAVLGLAGIFKGLAAALSLVTIATLKFPLAKLASLATAGQAAGAGVGGGAAAVTAGAGALTAASVVKRGALWATTFAALEAIKADAASGNEMRSALRGFFGITDEHEPAPWQPGGAWHPGEKTPAQTVADRFPGPSETQKPADWKPNTAVKPWPDQSGEAAASAQQTTAAFVENLEAGLRQAEAAVQASVARMMGMLSFSASPSITPKIAPAPAGATPTRAQGPSSSPTPTRTAARGVLADYDNSGDLDWV